MFMRFDFIIWINRSNNASRFTREDETNNTTYIQDRPAIVVSSTSWSEDENFALLFNALKSMSGNYFCERIHSSFFRI